MDVFEYAKIQFCEIYGVELRNESKFRKDLEHYTAMYGEDEMICAIDIACNKYEDPLDSALKIGGILFNRASMRKMLFKENKNNE